VTTAAWVRRDAGADAPVRLVAPARCWQAPALTANMTANLLDNRERSRMVMECAS
jgi:hypothetical protein